jgi:hypothetical protein
VTDSDYQSSKIANLIAFGFCCLFFYQIVFLKQETIFLDYLNLAYHEAGHKVYSFMGETISVLGGSLGQLTFPLLISVIFLFKGQPFASSVMGFWFFENFYNIARYVGDALETSLPLVGGDIHDWDWLLTHWNVLDRCYVYADRLRMISKGGMLLCLIASLILLVLTFTQKEEELV